MMLVLHTADHDKRLKSPSQW